MQGISFVDIIRGLWHTYYMDAKRDFSRFKKMKRGDIWRDVDGDYILIKGVYRGWSEDKKSITWVSIEAILLSANSQVFIEEGYYPGKYIDDYTADCLVEKIA